jgi:hypothetical protein
MRLNDSGGSVTLWLSANDTYVWARRPGAHWPCSQLSGRRLRASFDTNGLYDLTIDGRSGIDCDGNELSAITSDYLAERLTPEHPCYFVTVGQFQGGDQC